MESPKSGNQEQSKLPLTKIIKGPSSSERSEIANKLANYLQYPVIDEEVIYQISPTQLPFKIGVIINSSGLSTYPLDQLLQLASTKEARLVIIKCTISTEIDDLAYDYEARHNVPSFNINMAKPFVLEDFVPIIIVATEFYEKVDFQVPKVEEQKTRDVNYETTAEVAQEIMTPKIGSVNIGGLIPTESMLREANAIRRHMIIKAIGSGYIGHIED